MSIGVFKGQCQGGPSISVPTSYLHPDAISLSAYSQKPPYKKWLLFKGCFTYYNVYAHLNEKRNIYAHKIKCFIIKIAELEEKMPSPPHFTKTDDHSLHILNKYLERGKICKSVLCHYFDAMRICLTYMSTAGWTGPSSVGPVHQSDGPVPYL